MHATPEYGPAAAPQPAITAVEVTMVPLTSGGDSVYVHGASGPACATPPADRTPQPDQCHRHHGNQPPMAES